MKTLIFYRESVEIKAMMAKLQNLIMEQGKQFFEVWVRHVSDDIMNLAFSFGERFFL